MSAPGPADGDPAPERSELTSDNSALDGERSEPVPAPAWSGPRSEASAASEPTREDHAWQAREPAERSEAIKHSEAIEHGVLVIRNRAAARIVERAALDVPGVLRRPGRLGALTGREGPRATVDMTPVRPNVRVDVALSWPGPVAATCRQVRAHVAGELQRLTGRQAARVDVVVLEVVPEPAP